MMAERPGSALPTISVFKATDISARVLLDPRNPDIVFAACGLLCIVRRTGGVTFESHKGAPGGDDNHALWIDPTNSDYDDYGQRPGSTTISMDGGKHLDVMAQPAHWPDLSRLYR